MIPQVNGGEDEGADNREKDIEQKLLIAIGQV
jgi:hypothetical protein